MHASRIVGIAAPVVPRVGWRRAIVNLPLPFIPMLGCMRRLSIRARQSQRVARVDRRPIASQASRAAGLGFVGDPVRRFALIAPTVSDARVEARSQRIW